MKSILLIIFYPYDWDKLEKITFLGTQKNFSDQNLSYYPSSYDLGMLLSAYIFIIESWIHITLKMLNKEISLLVNILKALVLIELLPKMRKAGV